MTRKPRMCESSVAKSSAMLSARYSCSGLSLILRNGSTATDNAGACMTLRSGSDALVGCTPVSSGGLTNHQPMATATTTTASTAASGLPPVLSSQRNPTNSACSASILFGSKRNAKASMGCAMFFSARGPSSSNTRFS